MIRTREKSRSDLLETRKLNRVASQRYDEMVKTGYDLITGQGYSGKGAKLIPRPMQMKKPPSVWQKLNVGTTGTSRTYEGATLGATPTASARSGGGGSSSSRRGGGSSSSSSRRKNESQPATASRQQGQPSRETEPTTRPAIVPKLDMSKTMSSTAGSFSGAPDLVQHHHSSTSTKRSVRSVTA